MSPTSHPPTATGLATANKPRCLIIYTGGTIGMILDPVTKTLVPASSTLSTQLHSYPEFNADDIPQFDVHVWPTLYDSSDFTPVQYVQLCHNIRDQYDNYDGFVILHGTDTLSYTASALSFMLENLSKPVVLTGSMIPLSSSISDAKRNLLISLQSCCIYPAVADVCIYFNNQLIRGNRSHKVDPSSIDAFQSMNVQPIARMGVSIQLNSETLLRKKDKQYPFSIFTDLYVGNIVVVQYTPGLNVNILRGIFDQSTSEEPIVLVLSLFGAGNAPTKNPALLEAFRYGISDRSVEIVVCSQCTTGCVDMLQYETGLVMHKLGSINASDMTIETIVCKLQYLMGKGYRGSKLKELMESNLRGELSSKQGYGQHDLINQDGCAPMCDRKIVQSNTQSAGIDCP